MADVNDDIEFTQVPPGAALVMNPFDKNDCVRIRVIKNVNLTQLADELERSLGHPVQMTLSNGNGFADEERPAFLFVSPSAPEDEILDVVADHRPDPDYGLSGEQRERTRLLSKLRAGEELSAAELSKALLLALSNG